MIDRILLYAALTVAVGLGVTVAVQAYKLRAAERDLEHAEARIANHAAAAEAWSRIASDAESALAECQAQWADAKRTAEAQLAAARDARSKAQAEADKWRERWGARPQGCRAALAELDRACPEIGDY